MLDESQQKMIHFGLRDHIKILIMLHAAGKLLTRRLNIGKIANYENDYRERMEGRCRTHHTETDGRRSSSRTLDHLVAMATVIACNLRIEWRIHLLSLAGTMARCTGRYTAAPAADSRWSKQGTGAIGDISRLRSSSNRTPDSRMRTLRTESESFFRLGTPSVAHPVSREITRVCNGVAHGYRMALVGGLPDGRA